MDVNVKYSIMFPQATDTEDETGVIFTCDLLLCFSVRANSSSQNPEGNNSGKDYGLVHQDAGNDRRQESLHTKRQARFTERYSKTLSHTVYAVNVLNI